MTATTMQVTICGPNLRDQSKGTFHVHAAGCADLARGAAREPEYRNGWSVEVEAQVQVAAAVYEDMIAEHEGDGTQWEQAEGYLDDFHFFPCCASLPVKVEAG